MARCSLAQSDLIGFSAAVLCDFHHWHFPGIGRALGGHWGVWAYGICLFSVGLTVLCVKTSLRAGLVLLAVEVGAFMVLAICILVQGGANGLSLAPFHPSSGNQGISGLLFANVFTIFAFAGFESATTLSGEVRNPGKTIPSAVMATTFVLGAFFVLLTYCEVMGFGMTEAGLNDLTTNQSPFADLAARFGGPGLQFLIVMATGFSLLALNLVTFSAASRLISALGRDGFVPGWLAKQNNAGAPGNAAVSIGVVAAIVALVLGSTYSPGDAAGWLGFLATLFFIICYAMLIIGLPIFIRRRYSSQFSLVQHGIVPAVALAGVLLVTYGNVYPFPAAPLGYFVYAAVLCFALAWVVARAIKARNPDRLDKIARTLGD